MNEQLKNLIQIYFICSILGIILIIIRKYIINSEIYFLKKETFNDCDYWCLSHYILYFLLGFYAPKFWYISDRSLLAQEWKLLFAGRLIFTNASSIE